MTEKDARKVIASNKIFELFLRQNGLIKRYIEAFKVAGNFTESTEYEYYIDRTLTWSETPDGWRYWGEINGKCEAFFNSINNEI